MADRNSADADLVRLREHMVEDQLRRRGIDDPAVLGAMLAVPRHLFVPEEFRSAAYSDSPQPIGYGQTISQPFVVASMTQYLVLTPETRVLEVGTGCGYQTAILAHLASEVFTIELVAELSERARITIRNLHLTNVRFAVGDGSRGWSEEAPFGAIIVTAAADDIPQNLVEQLGSGGRMILPVRSIEPNMQDLILLTRTPDGIREENLYQVRFVPLRTPH